MKNSKSHFACLCRQKLKQSFSSLSGKLTTLGLFFVENKIEWKQKLDIFFFQEKITLKHLKTVTSSDPRARLLQLPESKLSQEISAFSFDKSLNNPILLIHIPNSNVYLHMLNLLFFIVIILNIFFCSSLL